MKQAFTLMELLVVIAILALLMGIIIPTYNNVREKAKATKARNEVKNLETALKCYLDLNRVWPSDWTTDEIKDNVFKALNGSATVQGFYEFPDTNDQIAFDPWRDPNESETEQKKHVYYFKIDDNYDNEIDLNDQKVRRSVIVWSPGPNGTNEYGEYGGGKDDIASWK